MNELNGSDLQVGTHLALANVAWSLDRNDAAPAIYAALAPFAEELAVTSTLAVASMGSVSRHLGQMATLMRDWPQVEVDFGRAMRRNMETRARGEVAETRFDWATALLRHGQARDAIRGGDAAFLVGQRLPSILSNPKVDRRTHARRTVWAIPVRVLDRHIHCSPCSRTARA